MGRGGGRGRGAPHGLSPRTRRVDRRACPRHTRGRPGRRLAPRRLLPPRRGPPECCRRDQIPAIRFGTDGWRGVIADDFTEANAAAVVQAAATSVGGRGGRPGAPARGRLRHPLQLARRRPARRGHPRRQRLARPPGRSPGADPGRLLRGDRPRRGRRPRRHRQPQPGALQRDQAQGPVRRLGDAGVHRARRGGARPDGAPPAAGAGRRPRRDGRPPARSTSIACGAASSSTGARRARSASWPTRSTARRTGSCARWCRPRGARCGFSTTRPIRSSAGSIPSRSRRISTSSPPRCGDGARTSGSRWTGTGTGSAP